jgi:hypothetical protein
MDALRRDFIKPGAFLFHIDWHADFALSSSTLVDDNERIADNQEKELEDFVKTRLSVLNYEFIVLAMYRGVIGDAVSIDKENDHNHIYGEPKKMTYGTTNRTEFVDRKSRRHTFYLGGSSICESAGYQGLLTDRWTHQDVQKVFKENVKKGNLILDIDLDYFTYCNSEGQWALNERNLCVILNSEGFCSLLKCAKVVTVALEPFFCGNTTECRHILKSLNSSLRKNINVDIEETAIKEFRDELAE